MFRTLVRASLLACRSALGLRPPSLESRITQMSKHIRGCGGHPRHAGARPANGAAGTDQTASDVAEDRARDDQPNGWRYLTITAWIHQFLIPATRRNDPLKVRVA